MSLSIPRILFPTDLSVQSNSVAPWAKLLASHFHSELILLHVLDVPTALYAPPEAAAWNAFAGSEEIRRERRAQFDDFVSANFTGFPVVTEFAEGEPAAEIEACARSREAALVLLPTHGHGIFRALMIGSVTAKVLHDVTCPVWTGVHSPEPRTANACKRILVAADATSADIPVLKWASCFAQSFDASLSLVHAVPAAEHYLAENDPAHRQALLNASREQMEQIQNEAGVHLESAVLPGKPERVVRFHAAEIGADLVIIGRGAARKPFGRLRSSAFAILRDSPCPVISV